MVNIDRIGVGHQRTIPNEILLHIISLLDRESLIAAVGVNRLFADEVERLLYRSLHITSAKGSDGGAQAALASKPYRADYVRSLVITFDNVNSPLFTSELILTTFVKIQSLTILPATNTRASPTLEALAQCRFPYLTHFRSTWSLNDPAFRTFLSAHSTLTSIELGKAFSTFTLPTSFPNSLLPRLKTLDGHWSNVVRLVKGRPVSRVTIRSANTDSYVPRHRLALILPIIANESQAEGGVQRLSIHIKDISGDVARLVSHSIPGLRALELVDCSVVAAMRWANGSLGVNLDDGHRINELGDALGTFDGLIEFSVNRPLPEHVVASLGDFVPSLKHFNAGEDLWVRKRGGSWVLRGPVT